MNIRKKSLKQRFMNGLLYAFALVFLGYHLYPVASLGYGKVSEATSQQNKLAQVKAQAQCIPADGEFNELTYGNPLTDPLYQARAYHDPANKTFTGTNLISNPSFTDLNGALPDRWTQSQYGKNTAVFSRTPQGHNGSASSRVQVTDWVDGDAKWMSEQIAVKPGEFFRYEEYYRSTAYSDIIIETKDNGGNFNYIALAALESSHNEWRMYRSSFVVPAHITEIRIGHSLTNNGIIETDDYKLVRDKLPQFDRGLVSMTFDDGWRSIYENGMPLFDKYDIKTSQFIISGVINDDLYMTSKMIDEFYKKGHEIGSHTVQHEDLSRLGDDAVAQTLAESRDVLNHYYGWDANNFVSPYGRTNGMSRSKAMDCYQSMRGTATGFNTPEYDRYNLKVMNIELNTKPEEIATAVKFARDNKLWLILVYHEVESDSHKEYAASIKDLEKHIQIIKEEKIATVTMQQGLVETQAQTK